MVEWLPKDVLLKPVIIEYFNLSFQSNYLYLILLFLLLFYRAVINIRKQFKKHDRRKNFNFTHFAMKPLNL